MASVRELALGYPDLLVFTRDQTKKDIKANRRAIELTAERKVEKMHQKALERLEVMEPFWLNECIIEMTVNGRSIKILRKFEREVDKLATQFAGKIGSNTGIKDSNETDGDFSLFSCTQYSFKG